MNTKPSQTAFDFLERCPYPTICKYYLTVDSEADFSYVLWIYLMFQYYLYYLLTIKSPRKVYAWRGKASGHVQVRRTFQ